MKKKKIRGIISVSYLLFGYAFGMGMTRGYLSIMALSVLAAIGVLIIDVFSK